MNNWKQFNRGLVNRGNLTPWFSEDTESGWYAKANSNRMPGRPPFYSCIEVALTLRSLFGSRCVKPRVKLELKASGSKSVAEGEWRSLPSTIGS